VGTGSGVLALAAVRLGAARAVGVDNDPVAVEAARQNAALNGVAARTAWGEWSFDARFPVIVANIVSPVLLALRERLAGALAPGGTLVLCGILAGEADDVAAAFQGAGLRLRRRDALSEDADWVALTLVGP
jgi:ribosomal protein L11 methyltransferase